MLSAHSMIVVLHFLGVLFQAQPPVEPPSTVGIYAIVVADERTGPVGTAQNKDGVIHLLKSVRESGIPVEIEVLDPQAISPGLMVRRLQDLDPAKMKDRTLLFYYSGHGARDPQFGHYFQTSFGQIYRSQILAEIQAKAPALTIVLTDSCNIEARAKGVMFPVLGPIERKLVRNLFLQHRGTVDINASSPGQAAFYDPTGGLFTASFLRMFGKKEDEDALHPFDRDKDNFVSWEEAFKKLLTDTSIQYLSFRDTALTPNGPLRIANRQERTQLLNQLSQDPMYFGSLATRSDGKAPAKVAAGRKLRLGVNVEQDLNSLARFWDV